MHAHAYVLYACMRVCPSFGVGKRAYVHVMYKMLIHSCMCVCVRDAASLEHRQTDTHIHTTHMCMYDAACMNDAASLEHTHTHTHTQHICANMMLLV